MSEPRVNTPAKSERNTPVRTAYNRPLSTLDDDVSKKLFDDKENVPPVRALDEWRSAEDEDGETPLERATYACRLRYAMSEEELAMLERLLEGAEDATVVEG